MHFLKKRTLLNAFSATQFSYYPLAWVCHFARVDFVSAIWLNSNLFDKYLQGESLPTGSHFKFLKISKFL